MRHGLTALLVGVVAGCSSGSSAAPATTATVPKEETVRVSGGAVGTITLSSVSDVNEVKTSIAVAPDKLFAVLPDVYQSLGIPVTSVDSKNRVLGNPGAQARHHLGKTMLSRYIDCGQTQTAPNADTYEIYISVVTRVKDDGAGGSAVGTTVEALAKPMTTSGSYSRCASVGRLEQAIADLAKARAAQ